MSADEASATLAGIRADVEETVTVYDLDGPGKNSYPVSAAMVRHARVLLAAVEALTGALTGHRQWFTDSRGVKRCGGCLEPAPCRDDPAMTVAAALEGKEAP